MKKSEARVTRRRRAWLVCGGAAMPALCSILVARQAAAQASDSTTAAARPAAADHVQPKQDRVTKPGLTNQLEEVVVTASRRSSTIRKTTTAVSAYSGVRLQQAQITSLTDLAATTPNVQIGVYAQNANITIRGVGNNQIAVGSDPGVALHADSVYLGQSGLAASTFLDVNRVEILRGPQGTLFGRNATGGAINIIPYYPTADFHYGIDTTFAADPTQVRSSAYVNGALTPDGTLLGRVAAQQTLNDGYTRNLNSSGPGRLDSQNNYSGRAQLQWVPDPDFSLRLLVEHQNEDDSGLAQFLLGTPNGALPPQLQGAPAGNINDRTTYANQGLTKLDFNIYDLTADWKVGAGDLRALVSYDVTHQLRVSDGDGTAVDFTSSTFSQSSHQYYAELLYASDASKAFNYVIGTNFFNENVFQTVTVPIADFPTPSFLEPVILGGDVGTTSYAGFVHAQYEFLPHARVFAGFRYSDDRKTIDEFNDFIGKLSQHKSFAQPTYEVGFSYDLTRSVTGYVKYATGYKSGGFSAGSLEPAFTPETDDNAEVGIKGSYLRGLLQANLAGFHTTYSNLQVTQVRGAASVVTNAAQATINGAEGEFIAHPTDNLRIEVSAAWLNARFDQFLTEDSARPELGTLNLTGHQLPQAPHFTTSAGAYYDLSIHNYGIITFGARGDWKSRVYFSEFNLPISSQAAKGKVDLTVKWKSENARWSASMFALNVADAHIKSDVVVVSALLGSLALGELDPGREVGLSLGYHF